MGKKMMAGTGLSLHCFDCDNRKITIDFSGKASDGQCYRNDASILFFSANSYKSAFLCIDKELNLRFEQNQAKDIEHLILPYYFTFRHYVELTLKAIIVALTDESSNITHDLKKLVNSATKFIKKLEFDKKTPRMFLTEDRFTEIKECIIREAETLKRRINDYCNVECADEYYRYIFEVENKALCLKNDKIELDYNQMHSLFTEIRDMLDGLCLKIREIKYIYCSL